MTKPGSILVVDDNATNLDLLLYVLRASGYDVIGCASGSEGLQTVRSATIALVLCDLLMPGVDGYEFARTVKADPSLRSIPLIAVTALAMPDERQRALDARFDGYISKPIEPASVIAEVRRFLSDSK